MIREAREPFYFCSRGILVYLTSRKARTVAELLALLEDAPLSSIFVHTHHSLEQHEHLSPEPRNDFAFWIHRVLHDHPLAERVASIDPRTCYTLAEIRDRIARVLKSALATHEAQQRAAPPGEEFHLLDSQIFTYRLPFVARTLEEFRNALEAIPLTALYHHMFESRLRLQIDASDFSIWLEKAAEAPELARKFLKLDPYTHTLENLKRRLVLLVNRYLEDRKNAEAR